MRILSLCSLAIWHLGLAHAISTTTSSSDVTTGVPSALTRLLGDVAATQQGVFNYAVEGSPGYSIEVKPINNKPRPDIKFLINAVIQRIKRQIDPDVFEPRPLPPKPILARIQLVEGTLQPYPETAGPVPAVLNSLVARNVLNTMPKIVQDHPLSMIARIILDRSSGPIDVGILAITFDWQLASRK